MNLTTDQIREKLTDKVCCSTEWKNKLESCRSRQGQIEDLDVNLPESNVWVNMAERTFSFNNAGFEFDLIPAPANQGSRKTYNNQEASGSGTFNFTGEGDDVEIEQMDVKFNFGLFE